MLQLAYLVLFLILPSQSLRCAEEVVEDAHALHRKRSAIRKSFLAGDREHSATSKATSLLIPISREEKHVHRSPTKDQQAPGLREFKLIRRMYRDVKCRM
jgi:hypothetical protein